MTQPLFEVSGDKTLKQTPVMRPSRCAARRGPIEALSRQPDTFLPFD
jgi:hypothetical protein